MSPLQESSLLKSIPSRIAPRLKEMSGQEFHAFSRALQNGTEPWDHSVMPLKTLENSKQSLEVVKIIPRGNYSKLECKRSNGDLVVVSPNQTEKAMLKIHMIKPGTRLIGNVTMINGLMYAQDIELAG